MSKTFVGSRVRQLRSERGFSQAALAQILEISPSYLNQIELAETAVKTEAQKLEKTKASFRTA